MDFKKISRRWAGMKKKEVRQDKDVLRELQHVKEKAMEESV